MKVGRVRLIVNADDLGLTGSVNRGILQCMESGVVTSASLMVNMGAEADAMRRLRDARARGLDVGVGLHLNLVAGAPLSHCPSLTVARTGHFRPLWALAARALGRRLVRDDVERELHAQLDRAGQLLSPLGMHVTHIDSHRHAHCLPGIFDLVIRIAKDRGIRHVRHPEESSPTLLRRLPATLVSRVLRLALASRASTDGVAFVGLGLMGSHTLERDLQRLLLALPAGTTELMVHPGYDSPELAALDPYRLAREREVLALTSPALRARIQMLGMELTHFGARAGPA